MPVLPMFVLVPILHLGMVEQVCDLRRHAQHLHQVVVVVGIEPWPPTQKPCFLTTTLPQLTYINSCPRCLRRKSQQDKAPLVNIETSQPLELVHLDYLKIEPSKGNIENVLIITDHFTRYAQAFPSKTQTALTTAKLLWNNFILHYGFPEKIISDQGINFESELIGHLCQLAGVQKLRTSPHHPQTNEQCERFNGTLLNMLGT